MADPVIHYTFNTDGTNSGSLGSSADITLGTTTIDTTNKFIGTGSMSSPELTTGGAGVPQIDYNTGTTGTTISFWTRMISTGGGNRFIYSSQPSSLDTGDVLDGLWMESYHKIVYNGVGFNNTYTTIPYSLYDNNWHFFVITCSGGASRTVSIYLDNSIVSSIVTNGLADNTNQRLWLGGCYYGSGGGGGGDRAMNGNIDNFRIHDYVLSADQISSLYNSDPVYIAPIIHYTFDVDGTNSGSLGSSSDIALGTTSIDTTNKLTGTGSLSSPELTPQGVGVPQFDYNTGTTGTTISFWAKFTGTGGGNRFIYTSQVSPGGTSYQVMDSLWLTSSTSIIYYGQSGSGIQTITSPNSLHDNIWHHFVITCSGGASRTVSVYLDNSILSSTLSSNGLADNTVQRLWLGGCYYGNAPGGDKGMYGNIDNFRIHDYALPAAQINSLYMEGVIINAPIIHYPLDVDGTNNGSLGTTNDLTIPVSLTLDSNALIGSKCLSIPTGTLTASHITSTAAWTTPATGMLISFWVKASAWQGSGTHLLYMTIDGKEFQLYYSANNNRMALYGYNIYGGAVQSFVVNDIYNIHGDDTWHHVGLTFVGTSVRLYWDNAITTLGIASGDYTNKSVTATQLGVRSGMYGPYGIGLIDDFRVYEYTTNETIIDTIYKLGKNTNVVSLSGAPISTLQNAGATLVQMITTGVTIVELLTVYTVADLLAAGITQTEIDIALTNIKIHSDFTISDGTSSSVFATTDAVTVYTLPTFAAKLTTDLGYAVNAGGDLTTTDSTPYYRLYLQFANAATLTGIPKDIFNIPFSDFSVGAGGQVNLRNVNLDAQMTIATSYDTTSNTSTIPAGNYFINNFVSTIETDLVDYTLTYDEPNKRITFDGLGQDISMSITSTDTTVFDTSITEITVAANTLPFITYGQPDPTFSQYNANGITTSEFVSNGYTIPQLLIGGFIPDWTFVTDANHFDQSYVKGFTDVSGSVVIRNGNKLITNGDLSLGGNLTVYSPGTTSFSNESMTLKSRLFMGEDISANSNVYVGGDLSVNGQFSGNFANNSIQESAISRVIEISGNVVFTDDVSFNGPTVDVSNTLQINQVEFNDATTMTTYDDNILSGTFTGADVIFKDSTFTSVICEGTATATTVTQSSDHRIKENVTELNETDTVDALVPIQYNNTKSGNHEFGLLAHELQEVYPDLVVGDKDGAEYQQVHYNGLIGVLVKEIQDIKQRLAVLNK